MENIWHRVGLSYCFTVSSIENKGKLALLWQDDINLEIQNYSNYHITSRIRDTNSSNDWSLIGFYGQPETNLGWCVFGDFNEIVTQDEKIGGRCQPRKQMDNFKLTLEMNGLVDLGWRNQKFTWSNSHSDETFTKERLDRVMANKQWLTGFSNPGVKILATSSLDHCPILLNTMVHSDESSKRMIFRYEAKWALEEDAEQAVKLAWQSRNSSSICWTKIY